MIEIEKPTIECIYSNEDPNYGKFVVEPLERGYGTTLGKQPEKNTAEFASRSCCYVCQDRRYSS